MRLQFEKFQTEMAKFQEEIARLSSKVEKLEKEKAELASCPTEVSPQEVFKASGTFSVNAFNIQSLAKFIRNGIVGGLMVQKLINQFSSTTNKNIFLIW